MFLLNKVNFSKGEYIYMGLNFQWGMNFFQIFRGQGEKKYISDFYWENTWASGLLFSLTPGACDKNANKMMGL